MGPPRYGPWLFLTMKYLPVPMVLVISSIKLATYFRQLNAIDWGPHPAYLEDHPTLIVILVIVSLRSGLGYPIHKWIVAPVTNHL